MIVQKLFNVSTKPVQNKPLYVKPKYKTYRQLLELDKPKIIVQNDSDDDNDDFLQKLMKKEQKLQKQTNKKIKQKKLSSAGSKESKKKLLKKQSNSERKEQKKIDHQYQQNQQDLKVDKDQPEIFTTKKFQGSIQQANFSNISQNKKQNKVILSNSPIEPILQKQKSLQQKTIFVVKKRQRSQTTLNLWQNLQLQSLKKNNSYKKRNDLLDKKDLASIVRLSLHNKQADVVRNQFMVSSCRKKSEGYQMLRELISGKMNEISRKESKNLHETKLNPQKTKIQHQLSSLKKNQVKMKGISKPLQYLLQSALSAPVQQILWSKMSGSCGERKIRMKDKLFRSPYQQELFIRSLANFK